MLGQDPEISAPKKYTRLSSIQSKPKEVVVVVVVAVVAVVIIFGHNNLTLKFCQN